MKYLPDEEQEILDRHVGKCMERIEAIRVEEPMLGIIKDIVRKALRYLAADLVEAQDDND